MSGYTFSAESEPLKNNDTIQVILDIGALCSPAKSALLGYVASLGLDASKTQHLTWANAEVNVYVEQISANYYLPSLGTQTPAPDIKRSSTLSDKVAEISSLTGKYPKCKFILWKRSNPASAWVWVATDLIQNYGNRVNYLDLMIPYLTRGNVGIVGRDTQIGVQFVTDTFINSTLPQAQDKIAIQSSVRVELDLLDAKKNDETEALKGRIAALENLLQLFGATTPSVAGTNGLVKGADVGQQNFLLKGDRTWQDPVALPVSVAATTAINNAVTSLIASSPATLDTLNELAAALDNDPNFATTITNLIGSKVGKAGNETIAGIKTFSNTTQSTLPSNGGTVFLGGVGVVGDLNIGGLVKSNNKIIVQTAAPLNIAANTWFTVGIANSIGIFGEARFYTVGLYIQYGDGNRTFPNWQWCGAGTIGVIGWKAGGNQTVATFRVEVHNGDDVICSLRLGMSSLNRVVQIMFDTAVTTLAPSLLAVTFIRQT